MRKKRLEIKNRNGKVISFKKFKTMSKEELLAHTVAKKQLIASGAFTHSKLKKLVETKELNKIIFDKDIYFEKSEVFNYLKNRQRS